MKTLGLIAGASLALFACAPADQPASFAVSDVQVNADLAAVSSRNAAAFWGGLEQDLSSAIATEFVGQTAPNGWVIAVDVDEIALSNLLAAGPAEDARLSGDVALIDPRTGDASQVYEVSASASQGATLIAGEGDAIAVSPSSESYYAAVVAAFARAVRTTIEPTPLP